MAPQDHVRALGEAQLDLEETLDEMQEAAARVERLSKVAARKARRVHVLLDAAQVAYRERHPSNNVVLFSGGTDKPPPSPDPVEP